MEAPAKPDGTRRATGRLRCWISRAAIVLAAAGWYVSFQLLRVSGGVSSADTLLRTVCGEAKDERGLDDCTSVLTSPQAYVEIRSEAATLKIPVSAFGMAYFAFVGLWYLLVGLPRHRGRWWHLAFGLVVLYAAWQSLDYIRIMRFELHRWCGGCLVAHALNGGLVVLTLLAWPWREPVGLPAAHPSARLALAAGIGGVLLLAVHVQYAYVLIAGTIVKERTRQLEEVVGDPGYILWDFDRQPVVSIPLREDEVFAGDPAAPNTVVVFGDFQCKHCRDLHEKLVQVAGKHPQRLRIAFRHYPQDRECNPNPRFRTGGHASACRAARAVEAARILGGREAFLGMRVRLWEGQAEIPTRPYEQQSDQERALFETWAAQLGLDPAAFRQAMDGHEVQARIQADVELGSRLGLSAMPVVYVNGKRLRNWSRLETWDVILAPQPAATSEPTSQPPQR